jgi:hypothetical protein
MAYDNGMTGNFSYSKNKACRCAVSKTKSIFAARRIESSFFSLRADSSLFAGYFI